MNTNTTLNRKAVLWMLTVPGQYKRYITDRWGYSHKRPMSRYSTKQLRAAIQAFQKSQNKAYAV